MKYNVAFLSSVLAFASATALAANTDDPCACDFFCPKSLDAGCRCEFTAKNKCYATQLAAGHDCPKPTISPICAPYITTTLSTSTTAPPSTPTPPPAQEGETCGTFRGAVCAEDLICVVEAENCADCPGKCTSNVCGGIQGIECPTGFECKKECGEFESDCAGQCKPEVRA